MSEQALRQSSSDPRLLGQRLTDARKACGRTQEEVAEHLGISRPTLIAVEKGQRAPKPDELIRMAALYERSVHELVRPGVPAASIEPHLRAAVQRRSPDQPVERAGVKERRPRSEAGEDTHRDSSVDPELADAIRDLQRFAEDYNELEGLVGMRRPEAFPPEIRVPGRGVASFAESASASERARLGLGDQPLRRLRELLENSVGLRILYSDRLPSHVAGMYAYAAQLGYCIVVNRKHPPERRRATLAHEYGHFLAERHRPGIDYVHSGGRKPQGERFAETFGMNFLMPPSAVQRLFFDTVSTRKDFQVADLCRMADYFGVSVQAMTLQLESLGLVSAGTWDCLREEGFRVREAQESLGLSRSPEQREPEVSDRFTFLAVQAFESGQISEGRLAKLLRIDRISARTVVARRIDHANAEVSGAPATGELRFDWSLLHSPRSA